MIVLIVTPHGIRVSRGAESYIAHDPATLAALIRRVASKATLPAPATPPLAAPHPRAPLPGPAAEQGATRLGQRLARARARYVRSFPC